MIDPISNNGFICKSENKNKCGCQTVIIQSALQHLPLSGRVISSVQSISLLRVFIAAGGKLIQFMRPPWQLVLLLIVYCNIKHFLEFSGKYYSTVVFSPFMLPKDTPNVVMHQLVQLFHSQN